MAAESQRARALFLELVENIPPDQWPQRLAQACGTDDDLRRRVQALLDAHQASDPLLDAPLSPDGPPTVDAPGSLTVGSRIGPYKLLQHLGGGGMGEVWVAEQKEPVQRIVALKLLRSDLDSRYILARFEAEQQALALMDHPNIAHVFDAGTTPAGRPYFVMELVKGVPITDYCDQHHLTIRERLALFLPVCQAVQHAHQKGIIHRDLKPSNVLVAEYDETPVPKVIDFGIAKAIGPRLTDKTLYTEVGQLLGTFEYMSPEQAKLNQLDVDTRSDIYSLGVLLYELLTGTTPLERARIKAAALDETLRIIREEDPPRPSTRLSTSHTLPAVAANRHSEPAQLPRQVRGELDWIVMKALEKDRKRRYDTASALGEDLHHHLHDEPVKACPPSTLYRVGKFIRRYRLPVTAAAALLTALVLGVTGTTVGMLEARKNARLENQAQVAARKEASERRYLGYISDMRLACQARDAGDYDRLKHLLYRHVPAPGEEDLRGIEWFYLWRLWRQSSKSTTISLKDPYGLVHHLSRSSDGSRLAIRRPRGIYRTTLIDVQSRREIESFGAFNNGWTGSWPAVSANGSLVVYAGPLRSLPGIPPDRRPQTLLVRDVTNSKDCSAPRN